MEIEAKSENKKLNSLVAITVVIISVFLAVSKVKDDNLIRGMEFVKADSVDLWDEYQAEKIKLHSDENALELLNVLHQGDARALAAAQTRLGKQIAKYTVQVPQISGKAHAADARYETYAGRHDQFGMEDGVLSISLALTAVAALTEFYWMLYAGWAFSVFGFAMGLAGMFGWPFHPDFLLNIFG